MGRGHEQQEEQPKRERSNREEPPVCAVCENVRAINVQQYPSYQGHLDERQREPAESARLLDVPLDGLAGEEGHVGNRRAGAAPKD